jgi:hypothetical protein
MFKNDTNSVADLKLTKATAAVLNVKGGAK